MDWLIAFVAITAFMIGYLIARIEDFFKSEQYRDMQGVIRMVEDQQHRLLDRFDAWTRANEDHHEEMTIRLGVLEERTLSQAKEFKSIWGAVRPKEENSGATRPRRRRS